MTRGVYLKDIQYMKNRLGVEVYNFLMLSKENYKLLFDSIYLTRYINYFYSENFELSDYSPFVLHICKFFENSLLLICKKLKLFQNVCNNKNVYKEKWFSLRKFFGNYRNKIEEYIRKKVSNKKDANTIIDKLFSIVEDYKERNKIAHPGKLLKYAEVRNYDSILTKLKELIELLFNYKLVSKPREKGGN